MRCELEEINISNKLNDAQLQRFEITDHCYKLICRHFSAKTKKNHFSSPTSKLSSCQSLKSPRELNELTSKENIPLRSFPFFGDFVFPNVKIFFTTLEGEENVYA